jgi:competence protein ComFC
MILTKSTRLFYDSLLTLVYPQPCAICGHSVENSTSGVACENCWSLTRIFSNQDAMCWKCGKPSYGRVAESRRTEVRCRRCDNHPFTAARACGVYDCALRETVLSLKRQPKLAEKVVTMLTSIALQDPLAESTSIVPVPLFRQRQKARGFNQALIIARSLSKTCGLPVNEVSLRRKLHVEKYRAGLDARGRVETVTSAFEIVHPRLVKAEKILLVDDVFTTGATAAACSEVLLDAGADKVFVLTVARTSR